MGSAGTAAGSLALPFALGTEQPAASTAVRKVLRSAREGSTVTSARAPGRSTLADSTPGTELRAWLTVRTQWSQDIPAMGIFQTSVAVVMSLSPDLVATCRVRAIIIRVRV